jgi:phospholipase D1/2
MADRVENTLAGHQTATEKKYSHKKSLLKGFALLFLLLALPAAWRWTPLNQWVDFEKVVVFQETVRGYPAAFLLVLAIYLLATVVLFPMTMLNFATVLTFGPVLGNAYALAGWLLSSIVGYAIGRTLGRDLLHRIAGRWLDRLIQQMGEHGFIAVLTIRVLPVAPFTLANLFVGASGVRFRDFFLASVVGRIPGILVLSVAGIHIENVLRNPSTGNFILLGLVLILIPLLAMWLSKYFAAIHHRQRTSTKF